MDEQRMIERMRRRTCPLCGTQAAVGYDDQGNVHIEYHHTSDCEATFFDEVSPAAEVELSSQADVKADWAAWRDAKRRRDE